MDQLKATIMLLKKKKYKYKYFEEEVISVVFEMFILEIAFDDRRKVIDFFCYEKSNFGPIENDNFITHFIKMDEELKMIKRLKEEIKEQI